MSSLARAFGRAAAAAPKAKRESLKGIANKYSDFHDRFKREDFKNGLIEGLEAIVDANGRNTFDKQVEKITDKMLEKEFNRILKYAANQYAWTAKLSEMGEKKVRQNSPFEQARILDREVIPKEDEHLGNLLDAIKDGRVSIEDAVDKYNKMWGVK